MTKNSVEVQALNDVVKAFPHLDKGELKKFFLANNIQKLRLLKEIFVENNALTEEYVLLAKSKLPHEKRRVDFLHLIEKEIYLNSKRRAYFAMANSFINK